MCEVWIAPACFETIKSPRKGLRLAFRKRACSWTWLSCLSNVQAFDTCDRPSEVSCFKLEILQGSCHLHHWGRLRSHGGCRTCKRLKATSRLKTPVSMLIRHCLETQEGWTLSFLKQCAKSQLHQLALKQSSHQERDCGLLSAKGLVAGPDCPASAMIKLLILVIDQVRLAASN